VTSKEEAGEEAGQPEFVWRARVTAEAPDRSSVYTRRHRFVVGKPLDFDAESEAVSAIEYALGALCADVVSGLCAAAKRRRVHLDGAEGTVEGRLDNPLVHLGVVGEEGHPGISSVLVKVYASSPDPEEDVRDAWEEALERSPLVRTLQECVDLILELHVVA
jgi:OsmC-like protein